MQRICLFAVLKNARSVKHIMQKMIFAHGRAECMGRRTFLHAADKGIEIVQVQIVNKNILWHKKTVPFLGEVEQRSACTLEGTGDWGAPVQSVRVFAGTGYIMPKTKHSVQ